MIERDALAYLVGLKEIELKIVNGQTYSTDELYLVKEATPEPLTIRNLSGIVDYLKNDYDKQPPVMIHIESPTEVKVVSTFNNDKRRDVLIRAEALLPSIPFKNFLSVEEFIISLQSCFVPNDDSATMLRLVGNIKEQQIRSTGDDGISQAVTTSGGVKLVTDEKVPNPVSLKPFRTFVEVPQPVCNFVFRLQDGPKAAIFEADGGAWKLQAIASIKEYLYQALEDEIKDGKVVIIA